MLLNDGVGEDLDFTAFTKQKQEFPSAKHSGKDHSNEQCLCAEEGILAGQLVVLE